MGLFSVVFSITQKYKILFRIICPLHRSHFMQPCLYFSWEYWEIRVDNKKRLFDKTATCARTHRHNRISFILNLSCFLSLTFSPSLLSFTHATEQALVHAHTYIYIKLYICIYFHTFWHIFSKSVWLLLNDVLGFDHFLTNIHTDEFIQ